jgi:hypothetical protein
MLEKDTFVLNGAVQAFRKAQVAPENALASHISMIKTTPTPKLTPPRLV